jgi:peptidoglycan/LPS O-acetylase OafA/YrhL
MERHFSLYLDAVRFIAASMVVVDHFAQNGIADQGLAPFIPALGRTAVMIFFVLSGFVIAYTTESKQQSLKEYAAARAARIYSVALPLLLLAFAAAYLSHAWLGRELPEQYQLAKAYIYLPFQALFLGEIWNVSDTPVWLGSYWSLGYEVWYYIFFACLYFARGAKRFFWTLLVFMLIGHKLWLLLPVWLSGVALYHWQDKWPLSRRSARMGWLLSLALLAVFRLLDGEQRLRDLGAAIWPFESLQLKSAERYLGDYLVCMMVLLNFYCARYAQFLGLEKMKRSIRDLSSYTFTLYLAHPLVISMWKYFHGPQESDLLQLLLVTILIAVATYAIGLVTEKKKDVFARFFEWLFGVRAHKLKAFGADASSVGGTDK